MTTAQMGARFHELKRSDSREAAEYAYALAVTMAQAGNKPNAERWAKIALAQLARCDTESLEACAARNIAIGDVGIPSIFHEGVVQFRFREDYGINLVI